MPVNASLGSTIGFTVVFFDAAGVVTVPTSATLTVVYPVDNVTTASCAIGMAASGSFFTASWASGVAVRGICNISAAAPGQITAVTQTVRLT